MSSLFHRLNDEARKLIAELGSSAVGNLGFRDNWIFVGGKGIKTKSPFEQVKGAAKSPFYCRLLGLLWSIQVLSVWNRKAFWEFPILELLRRLDIWQTGPVTFRGVQESRLTAVTPFSPEGLNPLFVLSNLTADEPDRSDYWRKTRLWLSHLRWTFLGN